MWSNSMLNKSTSYATYFNFFIVSRLLFSKSTRNPNIYQISTGLFAVWWKQNTHVRLGHSIHIVYIPSTQSEHQLLPVSDNLVPV